MQLHVLLVSLSGAVMLGCSFGPRMIRLHDGPPQPPTSVALVMFSPGVVDNKSVNLVSVDGLSPEDLSACRTQGCQIELPPGEHTLVYSYLEMSCDALNVDGVCERSHIWYSQAAVDGEERPLAQCTLTHARQDHLTGAAAAVLNAAGAAMQRADLKDICDSMPTSGPRKSTFSTRAGLFYDAFFSAAGPDLHVRFEETLGPNAPPVKE